MTCTASGTAVAGQYANVGTVTGTPPWAVDVTDNDPSHYFGVDPAIDIEKATNGEDADSPTGPYIAVGGAVTWTYVVKNTGNVELTNVTVTDDQGVQVSCPKTILPVNDTMTCTASGTAVAGQYANIGTATGTPPDGHPVKDSDPSHYFGVGPGINIEKATNGEDADSPTGPNIAVGGAVNWTYVVKNTGNVELTNVTVTDDKGVQVSCPKTVLPVNDTMTCTASGTAVAGQYANIGTATGTPPDSPAVKDSDPSHYFGSDPAIEIQKTPDLQQYEVEEGSDVNPTATFTITVTNTGNVDLKDVTVTDPKTPSCDKFIGDLAVGESTSYQCSVVVTESFTNIADVVGTPPVGPKVTDSDPAEVILKAVLPPTGLEEEEQPRRNDGNKIYLPTIQGGTSERGVGPQS